MIIIYKELIKSYIPKLTKENIKTYALSKNENLTEEETTLIYNFIKNNYHELLNKNQEPFKQLQPHLRKDLFNKIICLYNEYSKYI